MPKNALFSLQDRQLLSQLPTLSIEELEELVRYHNHQYFVLMSPEVSDETFDKLVETLRSKKPNSSALAELGSDLPKTPGTTFATITHRSPMLSLDKCYEQDTFDKWREKIRCDLIAMPKIDGVACSLIYGPDGRLLQAATRGDGEKGENITQNVLMIRELPHHLDAEIIRPFLDQDACLEVRGEVFIPLSLFNEKYAEDFSSPRNLAAGGLKQKEAQKSGEIELRFFPYDVRGEKLFSEQEKFVLLEKLGFLMMPWEHLTNNEQAIKAFISFNERSRDFDFETDGVVFRANDLKEQVRLGLTAHHPRYAIAYKFQSETAATNLLEIQWSVSRTGVITPVAIFKPVHLSGAQITRASLHNLRIFKEFGLKTTSLIEINRRGGVIPYVERVLNTEGIPLIPPSHCPSCGSNTREDGDFLYCEKPDACVVVRVSRLIHFASVVEIEGLGPKLITKLFEASLLRKMGDIYRLTVDDLFALPRMGDILANKIINEISRHRALSLTTFLHALGIPDIGDTIAEILAANFPTIELLRTATKEQVMAIHGLGEKIADNVVNGLVDLSDEIDDLLSVATIKALGAVDLTLDQHHPLYKKSVVFTGKMAHLERKAAQNLVKKFGGSAPGAFSSKVDFLVIGDEGSPLLYGGAKSTKHKEAEKYIAEGKPVNIISETDFLSLLKGQ